MGISSSAFAQTALAVDANEDLYQVSLSNGSATFVGHTGLFLESIAYDPSSGRLFGHDNNGTFAEINPNTGAVINSFGDGNIDVEGMDFVGPDNLWYTNFKSPTLFQEYTPSSNSFGLQIFTSDGYPIRAMAFADQAHAAYVADTPNFQSLYYWDGLNPAVLMSTLSGGGVISGIDFIGSNMYGVDTLGNVLAINPLTGNQSVIGNNGHVWLDMTVSQSAVPEPASMAALGVGALALIRRRRNSR